MNIDKIIECLPDDILSELEMEIVKERKRRDKDKKRIRCRICENRDMRICEDCNRWTHSHWKCGSECRLCKRFVCTSCTGCCEICSQDTCKSCRLKCEKHESTVPDGTICLLCEGRFTQMRKDGDPYYYCWKCYCDV